MTLTPEQIAQGWIEWSGHRVCPLKDERTVFEFMQSRPEPSGSTTGGRRFVWSAIRAYRIIEAHGADAETARPTPFPASYDELVFDADGWSQPFITNGEWPEWLPDDALWQGEKGGPIWDGKRAFDTELAIRVRRREPKRETVMCWVKPFLHGDTFKSFTATIDLIDGKPDLSTLTIAEDPL